MTVSASSWILLLLALLVSTFIARASAGNEIYGIKSVNGGEDMKAVKGIRTSKVVLSGSC